MTKQPANIVFQAAEVVTIEGMQQETECSHCGRPLKVGVKLAGFPGVFGADCLAKSFALYEYNGRKYKHHADTIRERGIIAHKGAKCIERHGFDTCHFRFVLKAPLQSI